MAGENPYMRSLEGNTDDEIFEVVSNPSETDNAPKYVAAISIALKRELISEYQAENLLDGSTTVLDYNPNIINSQVEDFIHEKEVQKEEIRKAKLSNTKYGLILIGAGSLLLLFVYSGELFFPMKASIVGFASILVGFLLVIIGFIEKNKKKQKLFF